MYKKISVPAVIIWALLLACSSTKKMSSPDKNHPVIVFDKQGHRGCRGLMPENTIPAMLKAVSLDVTTLELDIVFTKDKVAILSHEPFFNHEITTGPKGQAISESAERSLNIYQMTLAEAQQYDVGKKPHTRFPNQQKINVSKPSLSSMIDSVESYIAAHHLKQVHYNIETKTNPLTDNIYHPAPAEFVERLMAIIISKKLEQRVIIQSFDFRTLQVLHTNYPAIKTAALIEGYDKRSLDEHIKALGFIPGIYSPEHGLVSKALVDDCHDKKIKIIPWTVNDLPAINALKQLGVDGIITDYPNLLNE